MKTSEILQSIQMDMGRERKRISPTITATIHEHRAPTDESVKILSELEQKAQNRIIESIHIKDNIIDAVAIFFLADVGQIEQRKYVIRFMLNGKEQIISGNVGIDYMVSLKHTAIEAITKSIAMEILSQLKDSIIKFA